MIRSGSDKSIIRLSSIIWVLVLTFGLLIFNTADSHKSDGGRKSAPVEFSLDNSSATVSTGIQYYHFQKTWIPNKDNFRLLTFSQANFLDNNKAAQKILLLDRIRKKFIGFAILRISYKLLPGKSDEVPILS